MLISPPTRNGTMIVGAVLAATVPAIVFTALGGTSSAAGADVAHISPVSSSPDADSSGQPSSEPVITALAGAVIPGPINIHRNSPSNVVTVRIDFAKHASTGWHAHPGHVFVQVVSGAITLRHADHGRCLTETVEAGHGFFETPGAVHNATNRHAEPAVAFATFVLPEGAPPELPAPVPAPCR